jgi:restriction endonuclease S subunit
LDFQSGFGAGKEEQVTEKNGIIQIRPTNIDSEGMLKYDKNVFVPKLLDKTLLEIDDVLFNNTNSQELVGKTAILKEKRKLFFSNHITRIKVDKAKVIPDYLWIILNVYQRKNIFYSICTNWNNQSGVGIELLKSLKIPLPPKEIQQQIVDLYNRAVEEKQAKEQKAETLLTGIDDYLLKELGIALPEKVEQRYFEASIFDLIGGRLDPQSYSSDFLHFKNIFDHRLKECVLEIYRYPTFFNIQYQTEGIKVIKGESIDKYGNIDLEQEFDYIDVATHTNFSKTQIQYNDLIFTVRGLVGKVGIYKGEEPANINANVIKIRLGNNVNSDFIWIFFNSSIAKLLIDRISSGQVQKTITVTDILNIPIPLPSIKKQNEIAEHIQSIRVKAKRLQKEAQEALEKAKREVEKMIGGG